MPTWDAVTRRGLAHCVRVPDFVWFVLKCGEYLDVKIGIRIVWRWVRRNDTMLIKVKGGNISYI